jgi:hypothetical protein
MFDINVNRFEVQSLLFRGATNTQHWMCADTFPTIEEAQVALAKLALSDGPYYRILDQKTGEIL